MRGRRQRLNRWFDPLRSANIVKFLRLAGVAVISQTKHTEQQHTLAGRCRYSGIALHTGVRAHLILEPAPAGRGIQVVRIDLEKRPSGPASAANVAGVERATTLACGDATVHTVEHVLATLYACGIDNAIVAMDGPEPPIGDGSSAPYMDLVRTVGRQAQDAPRRTCRVCRPLVVEAGESVLVALPADTFRISCTVKFGEGLLGTQFLSLAITEETFANQLQHARTFCAYQEIEPLMVAGLIRGGSLDNAAVIKDGAIISKDGLRYPDELVRHKILDLVGDLSLIGRRLRAHVLAVKPGHRLNVALARKIQNAIGTEEVEDDG
jgi:UDP-3-O-acyl N-acetylglucosamine deacetylase